jgi:hypothetical protein
MIGVVHRKSGSQNLLSLAVPHCADVLLVTVPDCSSGMLNQVMAWVGKGLIAKQTNCALAALGIRTNCSNQLGYLQINAQLRAWPACCRI